MPEEAPMATSQNGWSASPNLRIRPLVVAGESFAPGIRDDLDVYEVLQYVAEQLHERVEPIVRPGWHQADDWGWYYRANANDSNSLSNHSSGTAIDYNATRHPNGVPTSRTFTRAQIDEVHQILAEVDHVVRWGGDYTHTVDAMHFEINDDAAAVAQVARHLRTQERRRTSGPTRVEQFLAGGPRYDLALLDDAVTKGGRRGLVETVRDGIDDQVARLHHDQDRGTLVNRVREAAVHDRVLLLGSLTAAVTDGRHGSTQAVRDEIRRLIDSLRKG
jgi:hypothetical protein